MPGAEAAARRLPPLRHPRVASLARHLRLAVDLAARDIRDRYAGAAIGPLWLLVTPAVYLLMYWLVFGQLLRVGWPPGAPGEASPGFLLPFFCGLVLYLFMVDLVISSTDVFQRRRDYVRRAPFPLWVLWLANLLRTATPAAAGLLLLLVLAFAQGRLGVAGLAWLPVALGASLLFLAALSLCLAMLGPFLGDLQEVLRLVARALFYAGPIAYPLAIVPEQVRALMWLNPLTHMAEMLRGALVYGQGPQALPFLGFLLATALLLALAAFLYRRVAGAVADVV
ncbi:ABC transporter permease [Falsiroseomonas sp.]|uniref:ABC transporter permease n=1 Tax=Falsiroseomonas sp. TaxID=2870721 RepID=UPI003568269C